MFLIDIISWSLAQQAVNKTQKEENLSYIIHDMILSYLQDTVPDCQKLLYQQKFVESYEMKCEGNFAHLEPDSYIHHKLLYHVNAAAKYELLGRLLTDLPWLASCCIHWDSNSLLEAYKKYRNSIPSQVNILTVIIIIFMLLLFLQSA
jgi:apoptotic protease-activating factor